jgi:hypothetical protein
MKLSLAIFQSGVNFLGFACMSSILLFIGSSISIYVWQCWRYLLMNGEFSPRIITLQYEMDIIYCSTSTGTDRTFRRNNALQSPMKKN